MRVALAEKLLVKVMNWSSQEVSSERPLIQAMANFKYDEYRQFSPGIRFIESLARWLYQFEPEERNIAYQFIKNNLVFISNEQMTHLVNICFAEIIHPLLVQKAAIEIGIPEYHVRKIVSNSIYKGIKRSSLFLGLSDGARIDQLRRGSGISNEQIFSSYYISTEKIDDLLNELNKDGQKNKFNSLYLVDDFTGSGLSYFREEDGQSKGKIHKFLKLLFDSKEQPLPPNAKDLKDLVDTTDLDIHIIFYIARKYSLDYIYSEIDKWKVAKSLKFSHTVNAVQVLDDSLNNEVLSNAELIKIAEKYFEYENVVDSSYKKGKYEKPYLGFDQCALPLILNHNTPNNTLPILWQPENQDKVFGLFPRVTRHKDD